MNGEVEVCPVRCPKCGCDTFRLNWVVMREFFFDNSPLEYMEYECVRCGWRSVPRDKEAVREYLVKVLRCGGGRMGLGGRRELLEAIREWRHLLESIRDQLGRARAPPDMDIEDVTRTVKSLDAVIERLREIEENLEKGGEG